MCMIVVRPVRTGRGGSNIPHGVIETAISRHSDGFGIAWREHDTNGDAVLRVERFGPAERKAFRKALKRVDATRCEYVAHFRYGTQGPNDQAHAHPYEYVDPIEGRVLLFHNGVIDIHAEDSESDTEVFVRDVLAALPSAWWRNPALTYLVGEAIGWSKLVLMTTTETVNLQEKTGEWDGGLWYSSNHRPATWTQYVSGKGTTGAYGAAFDTDSGKGRYADWKDGETWTQYTARKRQAYDVRMAAAKDEPKDAKASALVLMGASGTDYRSTDVLRVVDEDAPQTFRSGGHPCTTIVPVHLDRDGDYLSAVLCDTCYTVGDLYVIDGEVLIDMAHRSPAGAWDDDHNDEADVADEETIEARTRPVGKARVN